MANDYTFDIPLRPPSVNTYWRKWNNRMVISEAGRKFKKEMKDFLANEFVEIKPFKENLSVKIGLYFKDNRRRDIDNYCKGILDSMSGIVFEDDSQINILTLSKEIGYGKDRIVISVDKI